MLNAFLSVWHADLLVWCELALIGILAIGTVVLAVGNKIQRSELTIAIIGFIGVIAAAFTNHPIVLSLAFTFATISAACLALHAERAANEKARKAIIALCIGSVGLFVIGAILLYQPAISVRTAQWAFSAVVVGTFSAFALFFMKTRFTSFIGSVAPVVFFVALLRLKQIADTAIADDGVWTRNLFLTLGVLLLLTTVIRLVFKKKRQLLSLSSIEHIGLVAFMIGAGPAGTIPAIIHLIGQAVAHSGLWHAAQNTAHVRSNTPLKYLSGAIFASLLGAPFSMLFVSILIGVGYALQAHLVLALFVFAAIAVMNVYLVRGVITLTASSAPSEPHELAPMTRRQKILAVVLGVHVLLIFGLGGYLLTQQGIQFAVTVAQNVASL